MSHTQSEELLLLTQHERRNTNDERHRVAVLSHNQILDHILTDQSPLMTKHNLHFRFNVYIINIDKMCIHTAANGL